MRGKFESFRVADAKVVFDGFAWDGSGTVSGSCYLSCEFGRGLLASPLVLKIPLVGPGGPIPREFAVSYLTAADGNRRDRRPVVLPTPLSADPEEYDAGPSDAESDEEKAEAGGNLALFEGWRFRFPVIDYPLDLAVLGTGLKLRGSFDLLLGNGGELAFNLHGELAAPARPLALEPRVVTGAARNSHRPPSRSPTSTSVRSAVGCGSAGCRRWPSRSTRSRGSASAAVGPQRWPTRSKTAPARASRSSRSHSRPMAWAAASCSASTGT